MNIWRRGTAGAIALAVSSIVHGCGFCEEDRVAAAYDYNVVTSALAQGHEVAFFSITNRRADAAVPGDALANLLETARGVDPHSFRVSAELATLSFAYDPARGKPAAIVKGIGGKLGALGVDLALLRVMDRRSYAKPVATTPR